MSWMGGWLATLLLLAVLFGAAYWAAQPRDLNR